MPFKEGSGLYVCLAVFVCKARATDMTRKPGKGKNRKV